MGRDSALRHIPASCGPSLHNPPPRYKEWLPSLMTHPLVRVRGWLLRRWKWSGAHVFGDVVIGLPVFSDDVLKVTGSSAATQTEAIALTTAGITWAAGNSEG